MTPLHPLVADRWSTRAFDARHELACEQAAVLLEAARWAPSAMNAQPWRFLLARRGTPHHEALLEALAPGNQVWAHRASALLLAAVEVRDEDGADRPWALYELGLAVANVVVQAGADGLSAHQMAGFDAAAVRTSLDLDDALQPVVVVALGVHDGTAELPGPLAERETAPRTRLPLSALVLGGAVPALPIAS